MQLTLTPRDGESVLSVSGELTLVDAAEFKAEMLKALASSPRVVIDTRELTDIDLAGLQLFCAAHQSALANGKEVCLTPEVSAALTQQAAQAGLSGCNCGKTGTLDCLWNGGEC